MRGDALDLRVASLFGSLAGELSPAVRHVDGRRQCWSRVDGVQPWIRASFTPSTRRSKKDAASRTRGENVHCLISWAYSMGALGMPTVLGFREEAVGERWTLVGLFGGGV